MRHHIYEDSEYYKVAILIKGSSFNKQEIYNTYVEPVAKQGIPIKDVIAFNLDYNEVGKAPSSFIKDYLGTLLPVLEDLKIKYLYVADAAYFKVLTGQTKAESSFGYVLPCKIKGYEHMHVVLSVNYQALIYNPSLQAKIKMSITALVSHVDGTYLALGSGIIHSAQYPEGVQAIAEALEELHQYPSLTADIEGFSLRFNEAGIGTIAFAWDQHNGIAFACDYLEIHNSPNYGTQDRSQTIRHLLREFFESYQGTITWHYAPYDLKAIIYALWMKDLLDTEGMLKGLEVMTRLFNDTKIIAYLATNSTAGNVLGLKSLAHEFAGNWANEDIVDIRKIPLPELLQYNLVDALSTQYVLHKYYPIMVQDRQEELYLSLMLPSLKLIIQIELTGMPMSRNKIQEIKESLETKQYLYLALIQSSPVIKTLNLVLQTSEMEKANAKLKVKQHPLEKFIGVGFNPNSGPQLQRLLYEQMCLPVLDYTDTKQPATGAETIEKLIHHTEFASYKELLGALIAYGKISKILSTFIPAFEQAISKDDSDTVWLHGSFNLGGTVSGRLSSSDPKFWALQ